MNIGLYRGKPFHCVLIAVVLLISATVRAQQAEFIWSEEDQNGSQIMLSSYKQGAWQPGEKIVDDNNLNILPAIAVNSKNHKLAVWSAVSTNHSELKYSIKRGGKWQAAQTLSKQMSTNLAPVVVFDNNDICWVFWSANSGEDDDIYVSKYIQGEWTQAERVNQDNSIPDILPEAGQDENGNVWVTWQQLQNNGYVELSRSFEIQSKRRLAQSSATKIDKIRQMKQQSDLGSAIQPPEFVKTRSRATLYLPGNKTRPSRPVKGNIN